MKQTTSFKSLLLKSIFGFSLFIFLIVATTLIAKVSQQENDDLEQDTFLWANFLAKKSIPYLKDDLNKTYIKLNQVLKKHIIMPFINRIHIYQHNADGSNESFSTYNKNHNFPPIKDKLDEITTLSTINYQDNYIELIIEINHEQQKLGYLYIQSSLGEKYKLLRGLTITSVIIAVLIITLSLIVAFYLYNRINFPLISITEEIGQVSQSKKYQNKIDIQPYREFDILAKT